MSVSAISTIAASSYTPPYRGGALALGQNGPNNPASAAPAPTQGSADRVTGTSAVDNADSADRSTSDTGTNTNSSSSDKTNKTNKTNKAGGQLSDEARAVVAKLKARDLEVRQHEAAHLAAAGGLATSGASFSYQKGPDGVDYAIGGEVGIDVSPGRTPQETIERARVVRAAALAPAEPSGPDLAVAAQAQQLELQAQAELAQQALQPQTQNGTNPQQNQQQDRRKAVNQAYGVAERTISGLLNVFA